MFVQFLVILVLSSSDLAASSAIKCTVWRPMPPLTGFNQPIDHANPSGPTYSQRIQVVTNYYNPSNGPLLFHAGPENPANLYTLSCMNLPQWAQSLQAGIIGVEHRGFGGSLPWGAVKNYSSVTLDNVLLDYAAVIRWAVSAQGPFPNAKGKVIVFGGSYGGFLSFMMKLRFPDLVLGSIASAAPVYLFGSSYLADPGRQGLWFDAVASTFRTFHPECAARVSQAFHTATEMLNNRSYAQLRSQLRLCTLPSAARKVTLLNYLRRSMQMVSQFNFPFKTPPFPFDLLCSEDGLSSVQLIAAAMDLSYNSTKKPISCFPWEGHSRHSQEASGLVQSAHWMSLRGSSTLDYEETWTYITCSYFVIPITMNTSIETMWHYDDHWSIKGVAAYCMQKFGVSPTLVPPVSIQDLEKDSVNNIVFSNMGYDPVRVFSLQTDISVNRSVTLLFANHAAHTEDICAPSEGENQDIVEMRESELTIMQRWLNIK